MYSLDNMPDSCFALYMTISLVVIIMAVDAQTLVSIQHLNGLVQNCSISIANALDTALLH